MGSRTTNCRDRQAYKKSAGRADASETVTISFDAEEMASYEEKGAGCYVLEEGEYEISVRADSHNVLDSRTYSVGSTVTYDESNPRKSDDTAAVNQLQDAQERQMPPVRSVCKAACMQKEPPQQAKRA